MIISKLHFTCRVISHLSKQDVYLLKQQLSALFMLKFIMIEDRQCLKVHKSNPNTKMFYHAVLFWNKNKPHIHIKKKMINFQILISLNLFILARLHRKPYKRSRVRFLGLEPVSTWCLWGRTKERSQWGSNP
jgi:hypothetical protein